MAGIGLNVPDILSSPPVVGETIADWNTAESDIVTIGGSGVAYWPDLMLINLSDLTFGATITLRSYMVVNGIEELIGEEDYVVGGVDDVVWASGVFLFAFHEPIRITGESDTPADNGLPIKYDYILERR